MNLYASYTLMGSEAGTGLLSHCDSKVYGQEARDVATSCNANLVTGDSVLPDLLHKILWISMGSLSSECLRNNEDMQKL